MLIPGTTKVGNVGGINALIDTSDGLLSDLGHLCEASGLGAELDAASIPILETVEKMGTAAKIDPLELVLGPSDDYALIAAANPNYVEEISKFLSPHVHEIGRFKKDPGVQLLGCNKLDIKGWDHFKSG